MKSHLWTIIAAAGVIGLIVFAIQRNTFQPNYTAPTTEPITPLGNPQPTISSTITSTAASSPVVATPGTPTQTTTSIAPITATPSVETAHHTVQSGETPYSIASLYGISVEGLMAANNITDPTTLQIGQELFIPDAHQAASTAATTAVQHKIENGDTIFALADRYNSTVDAILANNPGLEPITLQIGQTINIPLTNLPPPSPGTTLAESDTLTPSATLASIEIASPNLYDLSVEMINAINTERQNNGLLTLQANEELALVALAHAQDMVNRNYFDHVTPEGRTLRDRLKAQGLEPYWVGENIQRNTDPRDQTVQSAVGWFMDSLPHRNNILHNNFTHIGVGAVEGPAGWYTFVLVFAEM